MSEQVTTPVPAAAPVAVPVAPVTTPDAAPVAAPVPASPQIIPPTPHKPEGQSLGDVRRGLRKSVTGKPPTTAAPAERDAKGQFTSPESTTVPPAEVVAPPEPVAEVPTTEAVATEATPDAEPAAPAEPVVIEIPEGHPLRDQGITALPPMPAEFELPLRAILNYPVRRQELTQAHEQIATTNQQAAEQKAEADFWFEKAQFFASNPQMALQVSRLKEEHGDEAAKRFVVGMMQEDMAALQTRVQEARTESQQTANQSQAQVFVQAARSALATQYPGLQMDQINQLISTYGTRVSMGIYPEPHADSLFSYAKEVLGEKAVAMSTPPESPEEIEARVRTQITAEVAQKAEQDAQEHQRARAANPMGRLRNTAPVSQGAGAAATPQQQQEADRPQTAREARRALRTRPNMARPPGR